MKITAINVQNFQAITDIGLAIDRPVVLVAGANEQGKTSLQEAIRLALTGDVVRVKLKKDYPALVRDGAKAAAVLVKHTAGEAAITLPDGKRTMSGEQIHGALPFVLDPPRFAGLDDNERRSMLFALTGTSAAPQVIRQKLIDRGCSADKVDAVAPLLVSGFPAANDYAKTKATECRGAWKQITGETYGDKKAENWKADKPVIDTAGLDETRAALTAANERISAETMQLGEYRAAARQQDERRAKVAGLQEQAWKLERITVKLEKDRGDLAEWQGKVETTRAKATGTTKAPPTYPCPCCGAVLMHRLADGALVEYEAPAQQADPEAVAALPEYERALNMIVRAVANGERDLEQAKAADAALKEIESTPDTVTSAQISDLESSIANLKHEVANHQSALRLVEDAQRKATAADEKTRAAAETHGHLKDWIKIAEALAPDGIPGEILAGAIAPFNDRLRATATATGWAQVSVDPDMSVRIGGRLYSLCSESARWRADAALAEAIAHVSGLRLISLDRMDVLDMGNRSTLLRWLHGMATAGEIDTAMVFATLKGMPNLPGDTFQALWLERGEISQYQAAA